METKYHEKNYLLRTEAAHFLTSHGFPVATRTLAKLACIGGGPTFRKYGNRPLYDPADLLEWAQARTSHPVTSTSELALGNHSLSRE